MSVDSPPSIGFPSASRPATHSCLNLCNSSIFCSSCREPAEQKDQPSEEHLVLLQLLLHHKSLPARPLHSFPNWKDKDAKTSSSAGEEPSHTDMTNGATTCRRSSVGGDGEGRERKTFKAVRSLHVPTAEGGLSKPK